jgi:putative nucleotidyltransferase with HDIG domain
MGELKQFEYLRKNGVKIVLRITGIYLLFSVAWIFFSDRALMLLTNDPVRLTQFQTYKGFAFVISSSALIYVLLMNELKQREKVWAVYQQERENNLLYLQTSNKDLKAAYDSTISGWSRALELRDLETKGHSHRVVKLSILIAQRLGINGMELVDIRRGALLHDVGKMGIPDNILLKPGRLDVSERNVIEQHPLMGYEMLKSIPFIKNSLDIPLYHHERWDGLGYPKGLKAEDIPLPARIFAIADVWDAMTSDRPYREALDKRMVLDYIQSQSGKHFDPKIVAAFLEIVNSYTNEELF